MRINRILGIKIHTSWSHFVFPVPLIKSNIVCIPSTSKWLRLPGRHSLHRKVSQALFLITPWIKFYQQQLCSCSTGSHFGHYLLVVALLMSHTVFLWLVVCLSRGVQSFLCLYKHFRGGWLILSTEEEKKGWLAKLCLRCKTDKPLHHSVST